MKRIFFILLFLSSLIAKGQFVNNQPQIFNLENYGWKGDRKQVLDGVTNGTTTFTSATANFTSADVGKAIRIPRGTSSTQALVTTIASVSNSTTVILTAGAAATTSSDTVTYGTDNTAAIRACLTAIAAQSNIQCAKILVPGFGIVAGPLITSFAGANPNCQIPFPTTAYDSANTKNRIKFTFVGTAPPTSQPVGNTVAPNPATQSTIESIIDGTPSNSGATTLPPSVFGTKTLDTADSFINANEIEFDNMTIMVAANNENGGPTMTAVNWFYGGGSQAVNSNFTVDGNIKKLGIPINPASAFVVNQQGGELMNTFINCHFSGYMYGPITSDHCTIVKSSIQWCNFGRVFAKNYNLATDVSDNIQWCTHLIYVPKTSILFGMVAVGTSGGSTQYSYLNIQSLDAEVYIGSSNWYNTVDMFSDSNGTARGNINYTIALSGTGLTPAVQSVWKTYVGAGDSVYCYNIGQPPIILTTTGTSGAATLTYPNTLNIPSYPAEPSLTTNYIGYGVANLLSGSSAFTYTPGSGLAALTLSQNSFDRFTITNTNGGSAAQGAFFVNGDTYGTEMFQYNSGTTAYGAAVANAAGFYSTSNHFVLGDDNASPEMDFALGSSIPKIYYMNATQFTPAVTATNTLGTSSLRWLTVYSTTDNATNLTLGGTAVTSTATQLNYLASATGTTGTTNTNLVFSASPALTGTPTVPTASAGTNTTQAASTAFVFGAAGAIQASADLTAQTGTVASVATFTPAANGTFRIGCYVDVTALSASTVAITCTFTDVHGNARTVTFYGMGTTTSAISSTGYVGFPTADIRAQSGGAITVVATVTGVSVTYDVGCTIVQLR